MVVFRAVPHMFPSNDPPPDDNPDASLHERYFEPLVAAVVRDYAIAEEEAGTLVDEVLLSTVRHLSTIADPESWLLTAAGYAARHHLEKGKA